MDSKKVLCLATAAVTSTVIAGVHLYRAYVRNHEPKKWKAVGKVQKIYIYPFKGGKSLNVKEAECTFRGLKEVEKSDGAYRLQDRSFVVYNEKSLEARSGRNYPKIVLLEILAENSQCIRLRASDRGDLIVEVPKREAHLEVSVKQYGDEEIHCIDCGDEAARWLSNFLTGENKGLRLAYNDGLHQRNITEVFAPEMKHFKHLGNDSVGLNSDLTSLLLVNAASVRKVQETMENDSVTETNFRPNLFIDGDGLQPFDEDHWVWIRIGNVIFKNVMDCPRCIFTTVDPKEGIRRTDSEPLKTLRKLRKNVAPGNAPGFGAMLEVVRSGHLFVNETVFVGIH